MSIIEIKAPNTVFSVRELSSVKVFLAGGISGCADWQSQLVELISNDENLVGYRNVTLYNPLREDFDVLDKDMEEQQIAWEYEHLEKADLISFWFTHETIQPITLLELGKALGSGKRVIIGIDKDYSRKRDVRIQALLAGYTGGFPSSIDDLAERISRFIR